MPDKILAIILYLSVGFLLHMIFVGPTGGVLLWLFLGLSPLIVVGMAILTAVAGAAFVACLILCGA